MPVKRTCLVSGARKHSLKKIVSILLTMIAMLEKKINLEKITMILFGKFFLHDFFVF